MVTMTQPGQAVRKKAKVGDLNARTRRAHMSSSPPTGATDALIQRRVCEWWSGILFYKSNGNFVLFCSCAMGSKLT